MRKWADDLKESKRLFINVVYPEISAWFNDAELLPVEGIEDYEMAVWLDQLSGIDFWQVDSGRGMYGLASRVQPRTQAWGTFTIRKSRDSGAKTEMEKRTEQIKEGYLYPEFTVQAYTRHGNLENAATVRTKPLIEHIRDGTNGHDYWTNRTHNADFYCVHWLDLDPSSGITIYEREYDFLSNPRQKAHSNI